MFFFVARRSLKVEYRNMAVLYQNRLSYPVAVGLLSDDIVR